MKNWEDVLITNDASILAAMKVLDKTAKQIVVVVSSQNKFLGTITDGDIRRGLLRGLSTDDCVEKILNRNSITMNADTPRHIVFKKMQEKMIHHLPLINDQNEVTDILRLDEFIQIERKENHVVLMAGGLGSRLASLTSNCPKPMLKVGNHPILQTIIETFKSFGFYKFVISVNYLSEVIESYFKDGKEFGVEITYIREKTKLGTAGALSLYNESNGLPFIVMNCDLLTRINFSELLEFHSKNKHMATMCLRQIENQVPYGIVTVEDHKIVKIEEKPVYTYFVNAGIYVVNPEMLKYVPQDKNFDMPSFFESLISHNETVGGYLFGDYWIDIGRMDDYERAHGEFVEYFLKEQN